MSLIPPNVMTQDKAYIMCKDMVYHIAHKFAGSAHQKEQVLDDLVQAGMVGLMKAVTKYDNRRKVKFSTFARYYIYSAVYKECVLNGTQIRKTSSDPALKQVFEEFMDTVLDETTDIFTDAVQGKLSCIIKKRLKHFPIRHRNMFIKMHGLFGTKPLKASKIAKQYKLSLSRVHQICRGIHDYIEANTSKKEVGELLKELDTV